eukprot:scaffold1365_cov61-Phaeocystis_antarctica.AAC.2
METHVDGHFTQTGISRNVRKCTHTNTLIKCARVNLVRHMGTMGSPQNSLGGRYGAAVKAHSRVAG